MTLGPFFSLDGLDGGGKSTQCRLLASWLRDQGLGVTECADPGGTEVGDILRDLLLHQRRHIALPCEALLFMASRAQLTAEIIRPALENGRAVISDRFLLANIVYQGYAAGLDPAELRTLGLFATGGLEPDLTFVLDLPLGAAHLRRKTTADRLESRADSFHEKVRAGFLAEAKKRPDRIIVLDATQGVDQVQERIRAEVKRILEHRR